MTVEPLHTSAAGLAPVTDHFAARAATYDRSSAWCTDPALARLIVSAASAGPDAQVLDVACGTGLVARLFHRRVARVVGLDITTEMARQAAPHVDELHIAPAERMPFPDHTFDVVVCRQGIQFMELPDAVREMARVSRPGGRVVLVHLCAYGDEDRREYFEILRLRNPARRHFFVPSDLERLMAAAGLAEISVHRHMSAEDVDVWSGNGAIEEENREAIRRAYRSASSAFRDLHAVEEADGRIVDHMLFAVAVGIRPV